MPAYAIVIYRQITNPGLLNEYGRLALPTLKTFGARPLAANTAGVTLEGSGAPNVTFLEFADMAAARAWYESPEYQQAAAIRRQAAEVDVMLVEGLPGR